jgi:hypothetical protein
MAVEEPSVAFYDRSDAGLFVPTPSTVGPWDARLQHGGPPAALLGSQLEALGARPEARVAYFALEFLGPVPVLPMSVETSVVRGGKKIELLAATAAIEGKPVLRASAWRVSAKAGRALAVRLDEPLPLRPDSAVTQYFASVPRFGYGDALEWRFADGAFDELGPATVWSRLRGEIVRGTPATPLARALAMVDSANGISAELDVKKYLFVPVNLSVSMTRAPRCDDGAPWVGMQATTSIAPDGVGTTRARLFDDDGFFGEALQTLYVEPR